MSQRIEDLSHAKKLSAVVSSSSSSSSNNNKSSSNTKQGKSSVSHISSNSLTSTATSVKSFDLPKPPPFHRTAQHGQSRPGAVHVQGIHRDGMSDSFSSVGRNDNDDDATRNDEDSRVFAHPQPQDLEAQPISATVVDEKAEFERARNKLLEDAVVAVEVKASSDDTKTTKDQSEPDSRRLRICLSLILFVLAATAISAALATVLRQSNSGNDNNIPEGCFASTIDLRMAVDDYVTNNGINSTAGQTYGPIESWCVSEIEDFAQLFSPERLNATRHFNADISGWNVSKASDMSHMFRANPSFNQDLSNWDVSRVRDMSNMFRQTQEFNQDLSSWNVAKVEKINWMFGLAASFHQNLCVWGDMLDEDVFVENMFINSSCTDLNPPDMTLETPGPFCVPC